VAGNAAWGTAPPAFVFATGVSLLRFVIFSRSDFEFPNSPKFFRSKSIAQFLLGNMPPKKKGATLKGDEAREFILQYMQEQNKPFNAATLLPNFNGQVGKAEATRILETLAEEEFLSFKDYKKLRFYFYNQGRT
tara:strand:+ start:924 stop:1325 length:402 start_codon:yes stop_codon:yes gene_type:complete